MLLQGYGAIPTNDSVFSDDDDDEGNVFDMVPPPLLVPALSLTRSHSLIGRRGGVGARRARNFQRDWWNRQLNRRVQ